MRDRSPEALAAAAILLIAGAGCALLLGARRPGAAAARSGEFQRVVGGLGSGTATVLPPCERAFDDGLAAGCARGRDPSPGGFAFCPHHSGVSFRS